jgi:heptosyltransferase II
MQKSIIIRLPNWVGDVIMCLPALKALHNLGISLILFGKPWIHDLFKYLDMPMVTCPKSKFAAIQVLKSLPAEQVLLFTNSFSSAMIAKAAGKRTIGFKRDGRSLLLNHAIPQPLNWHETDVFNLLTEKMLQLWFPILPKTTFTTIPEIPFHLSALSILTSHHIDKPYIVLCPFAHGKSPNGSSKKWPHWQEFAKQIQDFNPVICPGPNEMEEAKNLFPHVKHLNDLKLHEYLAVLSQAQLIIANDSGPMHMACATGRPTIALFGATSEKRTAPRNAIVMGELGAWPSLDRVLNLIQTNSFPHSHAL